ncbi:MAG: hypothetical protein OJF59_002938 [Cytophagales bacterium]|jgi:hypothetical protein|nr:YdeI/OmpD-associated family protein [Bacteroidota bacterium]MBS1979617.1 YdeI/OmpD-associated family protein [Bacteroidota bacterium]WHZ09182.1 MAG: hypothetical protein OJF59_002938 [Cytophagales bacterium]
MYPRRSTQFTATLDRIGINPFIYVPGKILKILFKQARKDKGHIPVCGLVNGNPYRQTLVKYSGAWRLYINTSMLKNSPKRIGEQITISVEYDPSDRTIKPHPEWTQSLRQNRDAKKVFDSLSPSRRKEIVRYISSLKSQASINRNVARAINYLLGNGSFVGRNKV